MVGKKRIESFGWGKLVKLSVLLGVVLLSVSLAYGKKGAVELEASPSHDLQSTPQYRNGPDPDGKVAAVKKRIKDRRLRQVAINLRGATDYETVEIFNKLINSSTLVENVKRTRLIISPSRPGRCIASWIVMTFEEDTFDIESQLYGFIKGLDQEEGNEILDDLFFQASADDIEIVKKILPISATTHDLNFGVEYVRIPIDNRQEGLLYAGFD